MQPTHTQLAGAMRGCAAIWPATRLDTWVRACQARPAASSAALGLSSIRAAFEAELLREEERPYRG